jgi:dihydroorotase
MGDASKEMSSKEIIDEEKAAWSEVASSLEFVLELVTTKASREMVQDASNRLSGKLVKHAPLFKRRCEIELVKK